MEGTNVIVKLDPVLEALNLPVGTPEVIGDGTMWLEPIDNIFTKHSCDRADPTVDDMDDPYRRGRSWASVLEDKRDEYDYDQTVRSLETYGFVRPVTAQAIGGNDYKYGDGHHRLAAAIDLGWTHVPIEAFHGYYEISRDSGYWSGNINDARALWYRRR